MKIIYVHHANREMGNPPSENDDISKLGEQDAKIVSKLIEKAVEIGKAKGQEIKCIYTSPYLRCKKTAQIINEKINLPIIEDDRLNEIAKDELWTNLQKRMRDCIKDVVLKYKDTDTVICVTSGINVGIFFSIANKMPISENLSIIGVPNCCPLIFNIDKTCF